MKSAPFLAGCCAVIGVALLPVRADNAPVATTTPANLKSNTPLQAVPSIPPPPSASFTPPAPVDMSMPDSPDFSTSDPEAELEHSMSVRQQRLSEPDLQAFDQAQQQRAYDNDWMLRDYTAQLKKQGLANSADTDPSLLPQPTDPNATYKDPLLPENQVMSPEKKRQMQEEEEQQQQLSNSNSSLVPTQSLSPSPLQPLLPPITTVTKRPAMRDAWGSSTEASPTDATAPDNTDAFPEMSKPHGIGASDDSDNSLLDSPGMTAQQEGLTKNSDLSLQDALPDDNEDRTTPHINRNTNFLVPTTPTSDVAEIFKKQSEALQSPTAPTAIQPPGFTTNPTQPLPPVGTPMPLARPTGNGLRYRVPDPFDIIGGRPSP
jgi:hypothetical protein